MTVARELKLEKMDGNYIITSVPAKELENYRSIHYKDDNVKIKGTTTIIDSSKIDLTSAEIRFNISALKDTNYKFRLSNSQGDELVFGYDHAKKEFYLDRSAAGQTDFSEDFANKISTAPRISKAEDLSGIIILDKTSIELFFDGGKTVITEIFFPNYPWEQLSVSAEDGEFTLGQIEAYQLKFK